MTQPPDGQRPPGDYYRSPELPPMPPPPEKRQLEPDKEPPLAVRRSTFHFTVLAVMLMFLGVLMLTQVGSTARELIRTVSETQPDITLSMVRGFIILGALLLIILAVGHAAAAHGLRERKPWARPVGFSFSGILAGLGVLALLSMQLPFIILGLGAVWGIILLARPEVRDYLNPRADAFSQPKPPPGR